MKNAVQLKKPFGQTTYSRVTYDTGEVAEVSWAFIRELAPAKKPLKP